VSIDYSTVTELSGAKASRAQLERIRSRYFFAAAMCSGKDVLEVACGAGQGLGLLARVARKVVGVDIDPGIAAIARRTYAGRENVAVAQGDAQELAFPDQSFDVVIIYEAIYYVADVEMFAREAVRVLRPGGTLLICAANKDLPDFNPSPHSHRYFGPPELSALLEPLGFRIDIFGDTPVNRSSARSRILSIAKAAAVRLRLMPRTMRGKLLLKRIVFGRLVTLPAEVEASPSPTRSPVPIESNRPCFDYAVIFCVARLASAQ
jgi:SAM-dependent methyltransferase